MRRLLELSIFFFFWGSNSFSQGRAERASSGPKMPEKASRTQEKEITADWSFLEQAEDVEREAWWVITNRRQDGLSSPFRVFRAAALQNKNKPKTKINFKFCKTLKILSTAPNTWRIESLCQKPSTELGVIQGREGAPRHWKISWKTAPFADHFGLGTSILYNQQNCDLEVDARGHLQHLSCPGYARNRNAEEIVELKVFEYNAAADNLLKLQGEVKKDLHVIATIQSQVPLTGDIVVKEKPLPQQKPVEVKTEFSDIRKPLPKGESPHEKENNPENRPKKDDHSEKESHSEVRPQEVPEIEPQKPEDNSSNGVAPAPSR